MSKTISGKGQGGERLWSEGIKTIVWQLQSSDRLTREAKRPRSPRGRRTNERRSRRIETRKWPSLNRNQVKTSIEMTSWGRIYWRMTIGNRDSIG